MNETIWKATMGRSKKNPSDERILLLLIASGLPMHNDVHTIATTGITGCIALTTPFAYVFRRRPSVTGTRTTCKAEN
jgi:hypothetical protein